MFNLIIKFPNQNNLIFYFHKKIRIRFFFQFFRYLKSKKWKSLSLYICVCDQIKYTFFGTRTNWTIMRSWLVMRMGNPDRQKIFFYVFELSWIMGILTDRHYYGTWMNFLRPFVFPLSWVWKSKLTYMDEWTFLSFRHFSNQNTNTKESKILITT